MGCQWPGKVPQDSGGCCLLRNILVPSHVHVGGCGESETLRWSRLGSGLSEPLPGCSMDLHGLWGFFQLRNPPQEETACRTAGLKLDWKGWEDL